MASLIYSAIASLDGYVEDERGNFDWAAPDEEVHAFVNDLERPVGTYLYGRPRRLSTPGRFRRCPAREPGLVDECHLFLGPVLVGGGTRPARRRPYRARAVGRAPLSQRRRVPPLPFLSRQEHDVDIGAGLQRPDQRMSPPDVENRAPLRPYVGQPTGLHEVEESEHGCDGASGHRPVPVPRRRG
jgi:hypothetical protein